MHMFRDFLDGANYVFHGCRQFYTDRRAWRFALWPWLVMTAVYAAAMWGILRLSSWLSGWLHNALGSLPEWLNWLTGCAGAFAYATGIAVGLLLLSTTVCTLYELFGGFFFDGLIEYYEHRQYGLRPRENSLSGMTRSALEALSFALTTTAAFLFLSLLSLLAPVAGPAILVAVMGYYLALSYMITPGTNCGVGLKQLKILAGKQRWRVLGFGVTAYALLTIPLLLLLFLPGLVLGGVSLFHERLREDNASHTPQRK